MNDPLLVLDTNYLAHRYARSLDGLSHEGNSTDVAFGLLRDLTMWQSVFRTRRVAFCFDCGRNKRLDIYPEYKQNRGLRATDEEKVIRAKVRVQVDRLRDEDLWRIGFRNVLFQDGYEADDVIASVVLNAPWQENIIIVANDSDLYQLITARVTMYDPQKNRRRTVQWFAREHSGLMPSQWADVKALGGCPSDNVKGLYGIGKVTAIKFLKGELRPEQFKHRRIVEGKDEWEKNLRLVRLPFEGVEKFEIREDRVTRERWRKFCDEKGMKSLRKAF